MSRQNFMKREMNRITYRISGYNFHPQSPLNPNSSLEIQVTLLPSQDGNRQPIWSRSRRRSNELSKKEIAVSTWSSPTDKLIAHLEAVYQEVDREVYWESTKILLKPPIESAMTKSTGWSPKRTSKDHAWSSRTYELMPLTDDYRLQEIFCGALHEGSEEPKCTWT